MRHTDNSQQNNSIQGGFTLIDLMVGMVIALIASIVIFQVFAVSESYKRSTTGGSDALQSGGLSTYTLSRLIAAGGAGFASMPGAVGCPLGVFRGNAQLFGQTASPYRIGTALPAPFEAAIDFRITLAPALIVAGVDDNTPDVLLLMAGNHPSIARHTLVASQSADSITLADNTVVGINNYTLDGAGAVTQHDLLLAVDQEPGAGRGVNTTCDIAEAVNTPSTSSPYTITNPISLSTGARFSGPNRFTNTASYYSSSLLTSNLGPVSATDIIPGTGPQFIALGVGNDGTTPNALLSLNLLTGYCPAVATGCASAGSWVSQSLADNIISIKAIYGVSAGPLDASVNDWVAPTGTWAASALSANKNNLLRLRAIRLAVIARNAQPEKKADDDTSNTPRFSPASFTLFGGTSVSKTVTNPDRHYRYKVFDITIPLRNMVLMTQNP